MHAWGHGALSPTCAGKPPMSLRCSSPVRPSPVRPPTPQQDQEERQQQGLCLPDLSLPDLSPDPPTSGCLQEEAPRRECDHSQHHHLERATLRGLPGCTAGGRCRESALSSSDGSISKSNQTALQLKLRQKSKQHFA